MSDVVGMDELRLTVSALNSALVRRAWQDLSNVIPFSAKRPNHERQQRDAKREIDRGDCQIRAHDGPSAHVVIPPVSM